MNGKVVWITGLSSAGKSTLAKRMQALLREEGKTVVLLDGDQVREAVGDVSCGHDPESRVLNAYRICRFADTIARQGVNVIVATMSLYHEVHQWNRENFPDYFEVFLDVDLSILKGRDAKGLYKNVSEGTESNLPGMDISAEIPMEPHLVLTNRDNINELNVMAREVIEKAGL